MTEAIPSGLLARTQLASRVVQAVLWEPQRLRMEALKFKITASDRDPGANERSRIAMCGNTLHSQLGIEVRFGTKVIYLANGLLQLCAFVR